MSEIDVGKMDRKISILGRTLNTSTVGGGEESYSEVRACWAEVVPMTGAEFFQNNGSYTKKAAKFRIHYYSALASTMQISYQGLIWRIVGFVEVGLRAGHEIIAEARE